MLERLIEMVAIHCFLNKTYWFESSSFLMKKKNQKGRIKNIINSTQNLIKKRFALMALEAGRITKSEIEGVELAMKRILKNSQDKGKALLRIHSHINITKKALGVRMGKGKGAIDTTITRVKPGSILIEWNSAEVSPYVIWAILNSKFSIKTCLITPKIN